jgi:hypothetical protein
MITKGAPNEVFTILKWHLEIRIYELIDYLASDPTNSALKSNKATHFNLLKIK